MDYVKRNLPDSEASHQLNSKLAMARALSGGNFAEAEPYLADDIEWEIFEEGKHFKNKEEIKSFYKGVAEYFASIETDFREYGVVESETAIVIYGNGKFVRDGNLVNEVDSCDVYEFNTEGKISRIKSYCNSKKLV